MKKELKIKELKLVNGRSAKPFYKVGDYKGNAMNCILSLFKKC